MFAMFTQLFSFITKLFSACEKGASAIDHLGTWADESAGAFADEARITRQAKLNAAMKDSGITLVTEVPAVPKLAKKA